MIEQPQRYLLVNIHIGKIIETFFYIKLNNQPHGSFLLSWVQILIYPNSAHCQYLNMN